MRLDFSLAKDFSSISEFAKFFEYMLEDAAGRAHLSVPKKGADPFERFASLLSTLPSSSLVLLIDEYDAPLTAHLDEPTLFEQVDKTLSRFYAHIEACDEALRFFFMTGVTKLSKSRIFSSLPDLTDISRNERFGALLGYTENEIDTYFEVHLDHAAKALGMTRNELKRQLHAHYSGFCFDENVSTSVYCPWSVLNFLEAPECGFRNYWFQSGGDAKLLMAHLRSLNFGSPAQYNRPAVISRKDLEASQPPEVISAEVLLIQCGYLTFKRALPADFLEAGYPNQEVGLSMADLYTDELLRNVDRIAIGYYDIHSLLSNDSLGKVSMFSIAYGMQSTLKDIR